MVYFAIWFGWAVLSSTVIVGAVYWYDLQKTKPSWNRQYEMLTNLQVVMMSCSMSIVLGSLLALAIMATVSVGLTAEAFR